ncbi:DNA polymerase III subunit chi [Vibrio sp.]|uniref:DNA polymerase III subunit chi n=1 Tax=Vibrio sp. TaxID=678 RepID=UPI003D150D26
MPNANFYLIQPQSAQASQSGFHDYVLYLAKHFSAQGAKVYLNCQDKTEAEQLAELFWQLPVDQFVAHNLVGEGPRYATPIEIGHCQTRPSWNRQLVINLAQTDTTFANQFSEVVDFVPCEEKAKQLARERYKIYRQAGYQLQTIAISYP